MSANNPKSDEAHTPASRTKTTEYNHVSGILSTDNTQSYKAHTSAIGAEHDESSTEDDESSSEHDESPPPNSTSPSPNTTGPNPTPAVLISATTTFGPGYDPLDAVFTPAQITVEDGDEEPLPHWYQPHFRLRHMILEACDEAEIIFRDTSIKDGERALFHFGMSTRVLRKKVPRKHTTPVSKEWHLAWCEKHLLRAQTHFGKARDSFQATNIAMTLVYKSALAAMDAPSLDEIESRQGRPDGQQPSKQSGEAIAEHRDDLTTTNCGVSETEQSQGNSATALLNTGGPAPVKKRERGDGEDTTGLDDEPSKNKARK
ncbi:hypothetical protein V8F06_011406 [Rhypophila decipiens]